MINVEIYYASVVIIAVWMSGYLLRQGCVLLTVTAPQLYSLVPSEMFREAILAGNVLLPLEDEMHAIGEKCLLLAAVPLLRHYFVWPIALVALIVIPIAFLLRRLQQLKGEVSAIKKEQGCLVANLEHTISELELSREESYRQQQFMKRLAMVLSHDLQSPFRFLISSTCILHERLLQEDYAEAEELSLELKQSGEKTLRFLNDFTIWMKSISNSYKVRPERISLEPFFEEMSGFFTEQLRHRRNRMQYSVQDAAAIVTDRELFRIVLRNIIDNANKHCTDGAIMLAASQEGKAVSITVSDTGAGMPEAALASVRAAIADREHCFFSACPEERQGYKFIAHFASLLHADLTVESAAGKGTLVQLSGLSVN